MKPSLTIQNPKRPEGTRIQNLPVLLGIAVGVVGMIGARALTSLTLIVLARRMGVEAFGTFTAMYAMLSPLALVAGLGLDTWLLRQGGDLAALTEAIRDVIVVRLISLLTLTGLVIAGLVVAGWPPLAVPIVLATLGVGCEFFVMTGVAALRAQTRNHWASLIQVIVAALWLGLIWQWWRGDVPLLAATGYRLLAAAFGVIALLLLLRASLSARAWLSRRIGTMIRQARALFAADLLSNLAMRADLILVSVLIGAVGAGIYSPAITIINTAFLVPAAVWYVVVPLAARQRADRRALSRLLWLLVAAGLVFGVTCGMLFGLGANRLIPLIFGDQYDDAVPLLQIMALIPLLKSVNFCWALLMVVYDAQGLRARLLAGSTVFNILANLVAITAFGVAGAAWINLITELLLLVLYGYGARRVWTRSMPVMV